MSSHESVFADYNGAKLQSIHTNSDDDHTTVDVEYHDMISNSTAQDFISDMFNDVGDLVNDGDDSGNNEDLLDYYQEGSNNDSYNTLNSWAKHQHHNDSIDNVNFSEKINSIKPYSDDASEITYDVKYDFNLDDDKERIQVFRWKSIIKKINGHWYIVKSITNNTLLSDHKESSDDY